MCSFAAQETRIKPECETTMPLYWYDAHEDNCEIVIVNICGRTPNNHLTKDDCEKACKFV